jgi:biotin--protein ligase
MSSTTAAEDEEVSVEGRRGEGKRVVFVYDDEGVGPRSLEHTLHSLRQHLDLDRHEVRRIDSNRIKQQRPEDEDEAPLPCWTSEACLLVMPGGADRPYDRALRGAGNARIRAWVEAGGRYLGLCAGGYYGCARVEFEKGASGAAAGLEVCEARELAFYAGTARGPLVPPGQFDYATERGSRAARLDATQLDPALGAAVPVYYNGGCCFVGGGGGVALAHYNGLSLDDEEDGGGDDVARPVAIVSCAVGRGKAVLCGVHPEHDARLLRAAHADDPHLARLLPALERGEPQRQRLFRSLLTHLGLHLAPPPGPDHLKKNNF